MSSTDVTTTLDTWTEIWRSRIGSSRHSRHVSENESTKPGPEPRLTTQEVADAFGVPRKTVYTWQSLGTGPHFQKKGKRTTYRREWVDEWFDSRVAYPRMRKSLAEGPRVYVSPAYVAELLRVPLKTVYAWQSQGTGPEFARIGRHVRYIVSEVEQWYDDMT